MKTISGTVVTRDNINIAYDHIVQGVDSAVIVCPGFFNSKRNRWMLKAAELAAENHDVVIFDFRGHGASGGRFYWSAKEHFDLEAVLKYTKARGYKKIGILGFSLGAAAAVNLVSLEDGVDSMILVSCPSSFAGIDFNFWRTEMFSDLKDNFSCHWEGKGARTGHLFLPKFKPVERISKIKSTPILFIHGDKDWIVNAYHSEKLFKACTTPKKLEIVKNGLHAERLIQQYPEEMKKIILEWFFSTMS